jgi:hypothetical protein
MKYHSHSVFALSTGIALSLCLLAPACGSKEDIDGGVGGKCDPNEENTCGEGLSCTTEDGESTCTYAAGQPCGEGDVPRGGCGPDAECMVPAQTETAAASMAEGGAEGVGDAICLNTVGAACDPEEPYCANDLSCAETTGGEFFCFPRVVLRGMVSDTSDGSAVSAAHVMALDEEGSAVTDVAVSAEDGSYLLDIPVVRNDDGSVAEANFTLNGSAQDYQSFPSGVRVALPIDAEEAQLESGLYVIENALTEIGLIPLSAGDRSSGTGSIASLADASDVAGVLVVATGDAGTFSAITDRAGNFTVFNLPEGEYKLRAYGDGVQVESQTITVGAEPLLNVSLVQIAEDTATVSGNIQIVNAPGGALTSVILVVEDTFDENAARGEVPRGLRAPQSGPVSVSGDFSIEGVPEGRYVVLAAYENDDLVRDPDTNISGTGFVHIEVVAGEAEVVLDQSFKVTEALATVAPGATGPEAVSSAPTLEWADDSSEDWYDVRVFDAFGEEVWTALDVSGVSGQDTVTLEYDGPLVPGMYYQFRVSSWRQPGNGDAAPISTTEDLRGVFYLPAE